MAIAVLGLAGLHVAIGIAVGAVIFAAGMWLFRAAFRRRTGVPFKV